MGTARESDLLGAIAAQPDDVGAYQVYGDWLEAQGHPRGELIAIQNRLREGIGDPDELRRREAETVAHPALLGALAELAHAPIDGEVTPALFSIEWHMGFARSLTLNGATRTLLGFAPNPEHRAESLLLNLLDRDSFRFLRELHVEAALPRGSLRRGGGTFQLAPLTNILAGHALPHLRALGLGFRFWDELTRAIVMPQLDLVGVLTKHRKLETLVVSGTHAHMRRVHLPRLRELRIDTLRFNETGGFWRARHPNLERLVLSLGNSPLSPAELTWLLEGLEAPRLQHLALLNSEVGDELADLLVRIRLVQQLRTLDLSFGTLTHDGARVFAEQHERFQHLEALGLQENYIDETGRKAVAARLPQATFGHQERIASHKARPLPPVALVPHRITRDTYDQYSVYAREQRAFAAWSAGDVDAAEMHHQSAITVARAIGFRRKDVELQLSLREYRARQRASPRR